jgi:putative transposase
MGRWVARLVPSVRVLVLAAHGAPAYVRSDNGPEFIAHAIRDWLPRHGAATLYIERGCPWQNGFAESFNGRLRDECLNMLAFHSVAEARVAVEGFRRQYNEERPHSRLAYRTPAEFKRDWLASRPPTGDS